MNKIFKFALISLGLVISIIIIAIITLPMFFDPNDYKDQIVDQVEANTGRSFQLDGDLTLSVFPWLGVEIGGMTLGNAKGFSDHPMVTTGLVQARVKLLPLLKKEVEMSTVILKNTTVYLERNKSGQTNWDDLLALAGEDQTNAEIGEDQKNTETGGLALASLALGGIHLENSNLVWDDLSQDKYYAIEGMNLKTGKLELNEPVDLEVEFNFTARSEDISGDLAVETTVAYDLSAKQYKLSPFTFSSEMKGKSLPGGKVDIQLKAKAINADFTVATASLEGISINAMGSELDADVKAKNIFAPIPLTEGKVHLNAPKIANLLKSIGQDPAKIPLQSLNAVTSFSSNQETVTFKNLSAEAILEGGQITAPAALKLEAQAAVNIGKQLLHLNNLIVKGMGLDIHAKLTGTQIIDNPKLSGNLKIAPFNLRQLMATMNLDITDSTDSQALTNVALTTLFAAGKNSAGLKNIRLNLDDSIIKGNLDFADIENPAIAFNLAIDNINLDRYTFSVTNTQEQPHAPRPATASTGPAPAAQLPEDKLKTLKINGKLDVGKLTIANARLSEVKLGLHAKDAMISIHPAKARLYQGSFSGRVKVNATGRRPVLNLTSNVKNVRTGSLMEDLKIQANIDGTFNSNVSMQATGADMNALKKSLQGDAKFSFTDGTLKGVNFGRIIREVDATINGKTLPPDNQPLATDFSEMSGSINIANGLIENRDLILKSPLLRINGKGTVHLVTEKIDYAVKAALVRSTKGQGGKGLSDLERIPIPIKVTGTFSDPQYFPDIEEVTKILAQQKLEKILPKELKGLGEILGGSQQKETENDPGSQQQPTDVDKKTPEDLLKEKLQKFLKF